MSKESKLFMKNLIITGASKCIGKALAIKLSKEKNNLCLIARSEKLLQDLKEGLINSNSNIHIYKCDVSDYNSVKKSIEFAIDKLGKIDLAILNAGISGSGSFINFKVENLRNIFDVNVFGVANYLEFLIPIMKAQSYGKIAVVSSLADARGFPANADYCSSKSALTQLLEGARVELKQHNIDIITIRPGFVRTDMTAKNNFYMPFLIDPEQAAKIIIDKIEKNAERISFPAPMVFSSWLMRAMPSNIYEKIIRLKKYLEK